MEPMPPTAMRRVREWITEASKWASKYEAAAKLDAACLMRSHVLAWRSYVVSIGPPPLVSDSESDHYHHYDDDSDDDSSTEPGAESNFN